MSLRVWALQGIGEIKPGDDLAAIIVAHLDEPLAGGDVVVVTSKIISKAAGLATPGNRDELLTEQTDRDVARRGRLRIVRTHHGLTLAAAGIDASNLEVGTVIPLPADPDNDAQDLLERLERVSGARLGVVITDTAGRAWRIGQTDIAIGAAGISPCLSYEGVEDAWGNVLVVTSPAVADEIAGAADLVAGKLDGRPIVIVRGLPLSWFDAVTDGAAALIRAEDDDLFGLGARDAVLLALGHDESVRGFPLPDATLDLVSLARRGVDTSLADVRATGEASLEVHLVGDRGTPEAFVQQGILAERLRILARALRLDVAIVVARPA